MATPSRTRHPKRAAGTDNLSLQHLFDGVAKHGTQQILRGLQKCHHIEYSIALAFARNYS
jgi:hypothetical protein